MSEIGLEFDQVGELLTVKRLTGYAALQIRLAIFGVRQLRLARSRPAGWICSFALIDLPPLRAQPPAKHALGEPPRHKWTLDFHVIRSPGAAARVCYCTHVQFVIISVLALHGRLSLGMHESNFKAQACHFNFKFSIHYARKRNTEVTIL